jgi:ribose/xylose/arabinose/galactoside ABC-type transport system permease subunit
MSTRRAFAQRFRLSDLPNSVFAFLLVFVVASLWVPRFFSPGNLSTLLLQSSILITLSIAMSLTVIAGGIDLSMGGVLSMCGVIIALCMRNGMYTLVAIGIGLAAGALFGLMNGLFVTRLRVPPFIATFGSMGIARAWPTPCPASAPSTGRAGATVISWSCSGRCLAGRAGAGEQHGVLHPLPGGAHGVVVGCIIFLFSGPCSAPMSTPSGRTRRWPA